jgi:hypothetical protein
MRWLSTTVPTPLVRVSTICAVAVTCTCSATSPSVSTGLTAGLLFTCNTMPVCANVRKPVSVASTR